MKWLYVTGRSQRGRLAEEQRGMGGEGEAGSLTDGLTGCCCWADRNSQKHWADTNMPFQEAHSISNDFFPPVLVALCSLSSQPNMLLCTLAAQLFFLNQSEPPTHLRNFAKGEPKHLQHHNNKIFDTLLVRVNKTWGKVQTEWNKSLNKWNIS